MALPNLFVKIWPAVTVADRLPPEAPDTAELIGVGDLVTFDMTRHFSVLADEWRPVVRKVTLETDGRVLKINALDQEAYVVFWEPFRRCTAWAWLPFERLTIILKADATAL